MIRKTRIEHIYTPPKGNYIDKILNFDEVTTFVLRSNRDVPRYIDKIVNGIVVKSCEVPYLETSDSDKLCRKTLFRYGKYIAIFNVDGDITLINVSTLEISHTISSSNMNKKDDPLRNIHFASYNYDTEELYVGMYGFNKINTSAQCLSKAVIKKQSIFSLNKEKKFLFDQCKPLPLDKYPITWGQKPPLSPESEWLNINALMVKGESVFVHTNGGCSTRLGRGERFEFNFISKLDLNFNWRENFEIEEGFGSFSSDSNYFILHSCKKRNKLLFYNTDSYKVDFDISLTAKQNLGIQKNQWLKFDFCNEQLFVYNSLFLNICKLVK